MKFRYKTKAEIPVDVAAHYVARIFGVARINSLEVGEQAQLPFAFAERLFERA